MRASRGPILHADGDCFFASVALRDRPDLAGRPVAVVAHAFVASAWLREGATLLAGIEPPPVDGLRVTLEGLTTPDRAGVPLF